MKRLLNLCTAALVLAFTSCSTGDDQDLIPMTGDSETLLESSNVDLKTFQSDKLRMFKGPQVQYGDGKLRSFVKLDDENSPVEIGFIMTREVFENTALLPPEDVLTVLPLHQKALEATPYEHLGIKWSQGHPPAFFAQHFDFYFYKISNDERLAIPEYTPETAANFTLYPPDGYMPADYGTPPGQGGVYPQIGKHWLPLNLPDYLPFTSIMVLGTYNGSYIFDEPMATLDFLSSNPDFSSSFSQPELYEEENNYPTRYNIYVDPKTEDVYVTLSHFVLR